MTHPLRGHPYLLDSLRPRQDDGGTQTAFFNPRGLVFLNPWLSRTHTIRSRPGVDPSPFGLCGLQQTAVGGEKLQVGHAAAATALSMEGVVPPSRTALKTADVSR